MNKDILYVKTHVQLVNGVTMVLKSVKIVINLVLDVLSVLPVQLPVRNVMELTFYIITHALLLVLPIQHIMTMLPIHAN